MNTLFPITLTEYAGSTLFRAYVRENKTFLDETYGHFCFTGDPNVTKLWSYYEVTSELIDANTIEFITYDMLSMVYGGRGDIQEKIIVKYPVGHLSNHVYAAQLAFASKEYTRREEARAKVKRDEEIKLIHTELFGVSV
jgi:hypothetical protein